MRRQVRKDQANREVAVPGKIHAGTLMEKRGACGDANAQHTTGEQNKMSASTVAASSEGATVQLCLDFLLLLGFSIIFSGVSACDDR